MLKWIEDITDFTSLKQVAEDIHSRAAELGFDAFTSSGLDGSSSWRFSGHLTNLPLYYEFTENNVNTQPATIKGTYLDHYRAVWDLYLNNATCAPSEIGAKTEDDAKNEFLNSQAVFYQNGTWVWDATMEEKLGADNVGMLPIYIGAKGEESQGLCTGSENYWCVNKNASEADIQATLAFLEWVVTSETGRSALADEMGFMTPFENSKTPDNPLVQDAKDALDRGLTPVEWHFTTIPSDTWKDEVGSALLAYAQGGQSDALWQKVEQTFADGWKKHYDLQHS